LALAKGLLAGLTDFFLYYLHFLLFDFDLAFNLIFKVNDLFLFGLDLFLRFDGKISLLLNLFFELVFLVRGLPDLLFELSLLVKALLYHALYFLLPLLQFKLE
jgi:hypothetical protein